MRVVFFFVYSIIVCAYAEDIEERLSKLEDELSTHNEVKRVAETVAFTVFMDKDAHHIGINQPLPFNNVLTNIGGGYHPMTYIFTCPLSELYLFSFAIAEFSAPVRQVTARLVIDGQNVVDAIADPFHSGHDVQGTNTAVIQASYNTEIYKSFGLGGSSTPAFKALGIM
ncbi:complement C1q-like protein 2 [Mercenaria mercenaria]|uniref:complement C1q-like protein 2 n=1 Tax=Mercenaria mercenaria TaxID=6596 RepID=UPI00234F43E5|nr:complement C1q-like protein 2 [Mercenaria mercenaria]